MMQRWQCSLLAILPAFFLISAGPQRGGGGASVEPAKVPEYLFNIVVGRPGADSATVSILAWEPLAGVVEYGKSPQMLNRRTPECALKPGEPLHVPLTGLEPGQECYYRFTYRSDARADWSHDEVRSFHTQRPEGAAFVFTLQADSHLDTSTDANVYERTLGNMRADKPDFMIDLGDTTMVDKFGNFYVRAESQYRAQRYYFGQVAHSCPLFLVLGNHDGEDGSRLTGLPDSMPMWSVGMRKKFFPNPEPGGIFTGNLTPVEGAGMLQDYYAWQWGDALFVVLDPFWYSRDKRRDDGWSRTLGEAQYHWLERTLFSSRARLKFVFIHHLVGGLGKDVRGGVSAAPYMEWGGKNADGSDGFAQHRPGWRMPIHEMLAKSGVSIVFHGHDHLYAREELDHVIYQEVPQPGHPNGGTRSAEEYGYKGEVYGSSGHLRVQVSPRDAQVEYVQCAIPGITKNSAENGAVVHRYVVRAP